jgi:SAM-dependent methyltransferase
MVGVEGVEPRAERDLEPELSRPVRRHLSAAESLAASRAWWESTAAAYQDEHGDFLGDADFVWCPEGLREADARLLGEVSDRRVLEIGCGAAQCSRWLVRQGAVAIGIDVSASQLAHAVSLDARTGVACSAYGAVPFVSDSAAVMAEVARVLRPGGRWVFAVTHPIRWCFPDDPGKGGLTARVPYFDRQPYVEQDDDGVATYVEHHRTIGDRVREAVAAGLVIDDIVEPEWPAGHERPWGQWSPLRGRIIPGTAIFVTHKP